MKKDKVDQAVLQLLTKVREKKEAIKAVKHPRWLTSCTISTQPGSTNVQDRVNIQTIRDEQKLVEIAAFLLRYKNDMNDAAQYLGLDYNFTYMNYPIAHWLNDIEVRVSMLRVETQKKELDELNKRVDKLVTTEQRREMELLELQKILED